ncbi:MAG: ABC-F family ATP-binding cassette domain-containing protein [Legionellales bacterium]|nr:ABC-F family ATP-binding cassette domain-containing protein [Legionellales bacterium]
MIALNQIGMTYGQKLLFCDVSLNLNTGCRYALVGANGCGKSTFFKLLTGEEELSLGDIIIPNDATIGWLQQDQFRYEDTLISQVVLQGRPKLWAALQERETMLAEESWDDAKGFRFAELEEVILHDHGYQASAEIGAILEGLGIENKYHEQPLKTLSGGFKLRVLLARTLFQNPSILLLDEPTNHLDILSIQWLEKYLKKEFSGLLVFISHDISFIDHLADHILDIDYGEIRKYSGKYQQFLTEKALLEEQKAVEKKSAEEKIAHMQKFVDRFGATASKASLARSRMKMIEKIELPDVLHSSRVAPKFVFSPKRASAKQVCKVKDLSKSYQEKTLFESLQFDIHRGDRVAILGANGRGKSTLIKMLVGQVQPDEGQITWGNEVRVGYFSQESHDLLNHSISALRWLTEHVSGCNDQQIRQVLGQMLFKKEEVDKDILSLSGGEAARLLLASLILEAPNVLIFDEPTNHMDIETIDALSKALCHYTGTLIVVSHNRYFIESFANHILYFSKRSGIQAFHGKYHEFMAKIMVDETA